MEAHDIELINQLKAENEELAALWQEHQELESQLEFLSERIYLTSEEQIERKRLQKVKLSGRDRIEQILADYRAEQATG